MSTRSWTNRTWLGVAAVGTLVLAGCGDDEGASDTTGGGATVATEAAATTMVTETTEAAATTMVTETTEAAATTMASETTEAAATTMVTETTEAAATTAGSTDAITGGSTDATTAGSTEGTGEMTPATPGPDWPDSIVFTLTPSQETGGLIETAQPLADMLAERLGIDVEATVPSDYASVIVALQSGQAQIAGGLGPLQMVQAEDEGNADLILQAERFGSLTYVTQWFTTEPDTYCSDEPTPNDDGLLFCNGVGEATSPDEGPLGLDELSNVEGQTVAFVDQGSTSGYLVPSLELLEAGLDPTADIEPLFAGSHDGAVQAVYDGDATVGVSFNDARTLLTDQIPDVGEKVVVFGWSAPIPNDGFAVAGDLPDDLKQAITDAFVDISSTPEGQEVLSELYEIDGLAPVNSGDYDIIRDLQQQLGDQLD